MITIIIYTTVSFVIHRKSLLLYRNRITIKTYTTMKVVYARISTPSQKFERQLQTEYERAYIDICSGAIPFNEREQAQRLINDDATTEIEVKEVSRLGRNLADILKTLEHFTNKGINIYIQNQGLSTLLPDGSKNKTAEMIISILGTIAQQERDVINDRTSEGRKIAQAQGKFKGRKRGATEKLETTRKKYVRTISIAQEMLDNGRPISYVCDKLQEQNKHLTKENKYKGANRITLTRLIELGLLKKPD